MPKMKIFNSGFYEIGEQIALLFNVFLLVCLIKTGRKIPLFFNPFSLNITKLIELLLNTKKKSELIKVAVFIDHL